MENSSAARFFLGANSRYGFYSLYDGFADLSGGDFLWVIKGGPGCGKSSFMKQLGAAAENAGLKVEYILCSGDPDSLDGVWFPSLRIGYVDGTSPHTIETLFPGAASLYLDLGAFYDAGALEKELEQIVELNRRYKELYARAYDCISAAAAISPKYYADAWGMPQKEKIRKKVAGLVSREFSPVQGVGSTSLRFISAFTHRGRMLLEGTLNGLCSRVCTLDNELGMAGFYLACLAEAAEERHLDAIICPDPIDPELIQAILLPELSLGFIAVDAAVKYSGKPYRHIRLDALADKKLVSLSRANYREKTRLYEQLLADARQYLSDAKGLHDDLEAVYNPHVDFDGLYAMAGDHISWLLSNSSSAAAPI